MDYHKHGIEKERRKNAAAEATSKKMAKTYLAAPEKKLQAQEKQLEGLTTTTGQTFQEVKDELHNELGTNSGRSWRSN